jgi:hypothetical protein
LRTDVFVLEPLSVRHNEQDYAAWMSSIEHMRQTPGFRDGSWPKLMSPEQNAADLARHERDFADRAELDKPLHELVSGWLARDWPFTDPDYARR